MTDPTRRNAFGFPIEDEPDLYLHLRGDSYEHESLVPGWALWAGVVFMAAMFALAWVAA